ncbi:MAG: cyclodeaminase/cyclohydrolase family protein [Lachnospiraceae bacterium]|nr:cyclodeaminase/cyclohydrolase family protein [Lachnospiraceae bacterium]
MELKKYPLDEFCGIMGSDAPAPGGGSAAALAGAVGAALCSMVAALTVGKPKYAEFEDLAERCGKKAQALQWELLDAIDKDCAAFNGFKAAMALPKNTDEEKAVRTAAMQAALRICTESPLSIMELSRNALYLTSALIGRSNASASSDLGVSALMLKAALQGAWLNVLINIGSLKDPELADEYRARGEAILEEALPTADEIYQTVASSL